MTNTDPKKPESGPKTTHTDDGDRLWNNLTTMAGAFLAAMAFMLLLTFGLFSVVSPSKNQYVDIVGLLILPALLTVGLILMPLGILIKSWRRRRSHPGMPLVFAFPRINLQDPVQRRVAKVFIIGTFLMLPVVGVSAYHGYHFTDSTQFCGEICHAVMEPQGTTYHFSVHARVACTECHVGSGAKWFVRSKLTGSRQLLALARKTYSRPIPPAMTHMRPAQDTCATCHSADKFHGAKFRKNVHFAADEENTRSEIRLLMKTGGPFEGIHKHVGYEGRLEYIATDPHLQNVPWVRFVDDSGQEHIYRSDGLPASDPPPAGILRRMDCMDCHNRVAHHFEVPEEALDTRLVVGEIDASLPYIKRQALALLAEVYPDVATAEAAIAAELSAFYQAEYPEVWSERRAAVDTAITRVQSIYRRIAFPYMHVNWQTYPDNASHMRAPGCFRCHAGAHVDQRGETISNHCDACHTFLTPLEQDGKSAFVESATYHHSFPLDGAHAAVRCDQCHTGGRQPIATCDGCHQAESDFREGILRGVTLPPALASLKLPVEPMHPIVTCDGCHEPSQPLSLAAIDVMCMECHEAEYEKYEGMLDRWKKEIGEQMQATSARVGHRPEAQRVLDALRAAGPLHNPEAAKQILDALANMPDDSAVAGQ